jgi:signal transduction histidine kinase
VWPVVLLLFAVLVPAVSLLWFMSAAMRNERFAARQTLTDVHRSQLIAVRARLERQWQAQVAQLATLARISPPAAAFARCVASGLVDSVVLFDEQGRLAYPDVPSRGETEFGHLDARWAEAGKLEYLRQDAAAALAIYEVLARESTNVHFAARAWQAEARCLVRAGRTNEAIQLIQTTLAGERFRQATDPQGRLIAANADLMVLELRPDSSAGSFQETAERLRQRLIDYTNPALASPQRRFLMQRLQALSPGVALPTAAAEDWAARTAEHLPRAAKDALLRAAVFPGLWQFSTPDGRVLGLVRQDRWPALWRDAGVGETLPGGAEVRLVPPDVESRGSFLNLPVGEAWPGWQLALFLKDDPMFAAATRHQTGIYLGTGVLVLAAMGVLTLLAIRLLRRQTALARLKSDLAAAVSHELKTPLASMRVLVDTLLNSERWHEPSVREYLQLIAQENERLSRLIQNFLAFSRIERGERAFVLEPVPVQRILDATLAAVGERLQTPGCRLEVQIQPDLPSVLGDPDALATALINLLDNACKYTGEIKQITLGATAAAGRVRFFVKDNGLGIAARERKRIFLPFYQVDQRLSRSGGGCGLGLSLVHSIVTAHGGEVEVQSEPGRGSLFTLSLPAAPPCLAAGREASA